MASPGPVQHQADDLVKNVIDVMPKSKQALWTQIADKAMPTLSSWIANYKQRDLGFNIARRDLFFAYLKCSIESRISESKNAPANLDTDIVEFFISVADLMTKHKLTILSAYDDSTLKSIRDHTQDFVVNTERGWQFIHNDFIEVLNSINIVELTSIESRLYAPGISESDVHRKALKEFATTLFSKPEGPLCYRNKGWGATVIDEPRPGVLDSFKTSLKLDEKKRKVGALEEAPSASSSSSAAAEPALVQEAAKKSKP